MLDLVNWKNSNRRKPLLIQGARQVGKTYLVEQFGMENYKNFIRINFELRKDIHQIFEETLEPFRIIEKLSLVLNVNINEQDTLMFFDEIQECTQAVTSLKYFNELANEYHIIAAGSLLGVSIKNNKVSFPVGKVNFMNLYPMSFYEFLIALGKENLANFLIERPHEVGESIHHILMDDLRSFLFVGGMPEVVLEYVTSKNMETVRTIQSEIVSSYERDFIKYSDPFQAIKSKEVWNSIPYQLGKENKKFKYSDIKSNARSSQYDNTIEWLKAAGLIYTVNQIRTAKLPLKGYEDLTKFKIYPLDTGLLSNLLNISPAILIKNLELFSAYNGAIIEAFICNEIVREYNVIPSYWLSNSEAEVDFVFQHDDHIIPIEVKSGLDRNTRSIRSYQKINNAPFVFRMSPRRYSKSEDGFINIGLYSVCSLLRYL